MVLNSPGAGLGEPFDVAFNRLPPPVHVEEVLVDGVPITGDSEKIRIAL